MGDNGFSDFMKKASSPFRLFVAETMLPVFGNSNASATKEVGTQARSVTEPTESGASELRFGPCQYLTCMHRPNEAGCAHPNDYSRPTARR